MNNTGKILAGIAAGVAVGVILGVLFAPGKGSETRKKIADTGKKLAEGFGERFKKGKEKLSGFKDEVKERLETVGEKVEEYV
jgi:gas vesicle protein